jgi:phosphonoacetate hydrolase
VRRKAVLLCIDGLDPEYLEDARTPNLDAIARAGSFGLGRAVLPSVTNVNTVSLLTGAFPDVHGIASNYWYDPSTGLGRFIETADYLRVMTVLERASIAGLRTALLVTKDKLRRLLGPGVGITLSAECPPEEVIRAVGPPDGVYSAEIDYWQLRALIWVLSAFDPDLVYCSTTDYVMHLFGPGTREASRHIEQLDALVGVLVQRFPDRQILVTADHGMRTKTVALDLVACLSERGIEAVFVPPIKDRYVVHHQNMGGAGYLYVAPEHVEEATLILRETEGVEAIYTRSQAAKQFRLPADRIGDLFVLATAETVFAEPGSLGSVRAPVRLRSHGGAHETSVPIWLYGTDFSTGAVRWNLDLVRLLGLD